MRPALLRFLLACSISTLNSMPRMLLSLLSAGFKLGHITRRDFGAREVRGRL
jgi:hypothetical protein